MFISENFGSVSIVLGVFFQMDNQEMSSKAESHAPIYSRVRNKMLPIADFSQEQITILAILITILFPRGVKVFVSPSESTSYDSK